MMLLGRLAQHIREDQFRRRHVAAFGPEHHARGDVPHVLCCHRLNEGAAELRQAPAKRIAGPARVPRRHFPIVWSLATPFTSVSSFPFCPLICRRFALRASRLSSLTSPPSPGCRSIVTVSPDC